MLLRRRKLKRTTPAFVKVPLTSVTFCPFWTFERIFSPFKVHPGPSTIFNQQFDKMQFCLTSLGQSRAAQKFNCAHAHQSLCAEVTTQKADWRQCSLLTHFSATFKGFQQQMLQTSFLSLYVYFLVVFLFIFCKPLTVMLYFDLLF